jgi:hypothetical protein
MQLRACSNCLGGGNAEERRGRRMNRKQWRCFHCDELFKSRCCAAKHFGCYDESMPACMIAAKEEGYNKGVRDMRQEAAE